MADNKAIAPVKLTRIEQDDPLYTVRPRYVRSQADEGVRGTRAKFALASFLKTTKQMADTSDDLMFSTIRNRLLGKGESPYTDFLLTGLSYQFQEKIQLQPLFGDKTAAFAFGAAPVILQIQGVVTDDIDNNWFYKFILLYRDHLRGTKLARNFELAQFATNNAVFNGVVMSLGISQEASNDSVVAFSMQFLVRSSLFLSAYEDTAPSYMSEERLKQLTTDGSFTYRQVRDKKINSIIDLQVDAGAAEVFTDSSYDGLTGETTSRVTITNTRAYPGDQDAVINFAQKGSLPGLVGFINGLSNSLLNPDTKLTMFENFLLKSATSEGGLATMSVLATYGNFINTLNTDYIGGFGNFVGEIQRNVEAFNRAIGYIGVAELVDTAANIRNQINRMNNLVSTVKETYNNLKNLKNIFKDLKKEFKNIEDAWKNLRGSVSSFNESTSDRLKRSMRSSSADLPAVLGNSSLGISKEQAAILLGASSTSSSNPLDALATIAGQNTSVVDIVASLAARTGQTEAQAEALLIASYSTAAPDKSVIPADKPTYISTSSSNAILVF